MATVLKFITWQRSGRIWCRSLRMVCWCHSIESVFDHSWVGFPHSHLIIFPFMTAGKHVFNCYFYCHCGMAVANRQCVELGGDCCTSPCTSCNDGVGCKYQIIKQLFRFFPFLGCLNFSFTLLYWLDYEDPTFMNPDDLCRGCYYLGYKDSTTPPSASTLIKV